MYEKIILNGSIVDLTKLYNITPISVEVDDMGKIYAKWVGFSLVFIEGKQISVGRNLPISGDSSVTYSSSLHTEPTKSIRIREYDEAVKYVEEKRDLLIQMWSGVKRSDLPTLIVE